MTDWASVAIGVGAIAGAVGAVWQFLVRPALRTAVAVEAMTPTLRQIAADFRKNGRPSLKEQLDAMKQQLIELAQEVHEIKEGLVPK